MKKLLSFFLALLMLLTAVPLGVFADESVSSLADDPSFSRGYVYTLRTVRAYEHATRNDYSLTIAKGQTGYVVSRPNAGASKDRVEIRYNLDGKAAVAFVDANKVMYYQGDALETMKKDAAVAAGSIKLNNGSPLPPVRYELVPQPTADPTPEPTAEPTPEPTAEPVAEVLAPVITPAPIADVNPVETTLPIPGKTVVEEPVEDKFYNNVMAYYNEGYPLSDFSNQIVYNKVYAHGIDLPESTHYTSYSNTEKAYRLRYPEECVSLSVTLQYQFHNTWNSWDGSDEYYGDCEDCCILFYDGLGNIVTGSCLGGGEEMRTTTIHIPGNEFTILQVGYNNCYSNCYGFKVLSVEPLVETELTRIYANAQGHITLEWNNPAKASRYLIQRAELDPDTNTAGVFSSVKYGNSPTETSFTDTRTTPDTLYVYRIRLYNQVSGCQPLYDAGEDMSYYNKVFYTPFDHASYYAFKQPTILTGKPMGGTGGLRHQLSWTSVPNASKYQVLRSTSPNGTYGVLTETTDTSVVLSVAGFRPFYYKVRAFASVGGKQYGGGTTAVSDMITVGYPDAVQNIQTSTNAVDPYVTITWDKVRNVDGYVIYRSDKSDGTYVKVGNASPAATGRFVDRTTTVGQTCFYRVRAYVTTPTGNAYSTTSRPSGTTYAGHPAIPTGLTAAESGSSVNLNWGAVPGATGYAVFRKLEGQSSYTLLSYTTAPSYTDKICAKGQTYVYSVRAYRLYEGRKLLSLYSDPVTLLKTR